MANFILRKAEPKDVSNILRLIKVGTDKRKTNLYNPIMMFNNF